MVRLMLESGVREGPDRPVKDRRKWSLSVRGPVVAYS